MVVGEDGEVVGETLEWIHDDVLWRVKRYRDDLYE